MTIYIKNMVCNRCIMVVKSTLEAVGLTPVLVELGLVELKESSLSTYRDKLTQELQTLGFELLNDKKTQTIEWIKNLIIDLIQNKDNGLEVNLSEYLQKELHQDYSALSKLFFDLEGNTIEKFYILQKVEKVKS